jgi:GNAT superfamily N-acetyltransferase
MGLSFRLLDENHTNSFPLLNQFSEYMSLDEWNSIPREKRGAYISSSYFIALLDGVPVGFVRFDVYPRYARVYTRRTFVLPKFRRRGIAEALTNRLIRYCYTNRLSRIRRMGQSPSMLLQAKRIAEKTTPLVPGIKVRMVRDNVLIHISKRSSKRGR